jgi:hypothetical protein
MKLTITNIVEIIVIGIAIFIVFQSPAAQLPINKQSTQTPVVNGTKGTSATIEVFAPVKYHMVGIRLQYSIPRKAWIIPQTKIAKNLSIYVNGLRRMNILDYTRVDDMVTIKKVTLCSNLPCATNVVIADFEF